MIGTLKRRVREAGWREAGAGDLRPYCRLRRVLYEPDRTAAALALPENEFARSVRWEIFDRDPYRFSEWIYDITGPAVVEPLHGMVVLPGRRLARRLMAIHEGVEVPPPHLGQYWKAWRCRERVPRAVLLRHHYGESNYYHFFGDVLPILRLVREFPEYENWPLLVSRLQFETPFFQGMLDRLGWRDRPWIVQENGAVEAERLVCAKGLGLTRPWIEFLWDFLRVPEAGGERRLYLRRGLGLRRGLSNQPEVEALCVRHGFESVDPGSLTLTGQIELFSQARHVVAEHGAGCTNILFRRGGALSLLELMPEGYTSNCYFLICHLLGFAHDALRGPAEGDRFAIDPTALERWLAAL